MRKALLIPLLSMLVCWAWGQSYSYRYWIDNNVGSAATGSGTGETQFSVNTASLGRSLLVEYDEQTAIGKNNDNKAENVFEIGNGSHFTKRSNAFEVDWDGNASASGKVISANPTAPEMKLLNTTTAAESRITAEPGGQYGNNLLIQPGGNLVLGGGEYAQHRYEASLVGDTAENTYLGADGTVYIEVNAQAIANAKRWAFNPNGTITNPDNMVFEFISETALPLRNEAKAYNQTRTPVYSKFGKVVNVKGAVSPNSEIAAGGVLDFGTLPAGCRPTEELQVLCQGSGNSNWLLTVYKTGAMGATRYRDGAGNNAPMTTSTWLTFNVTFIAS